MKKVVSCSERSGFNVFESFTFVVSKEANPKKTREMKRDLSNRKSEILDRLSDKNQLDWVSFSNDRVDQYLLILKHALAWPECHGELRSTIQDVAKQLYMESRKGNLVSTYLFLTRFVNALQIAPDKTLPFAQQIFATWNVVFSPDCGLDLYMALREKDMSVAWRFVLLGRLISFFELCNQVNLNEIVPSKRAAFLQLFIEFLTHQKTVFSKFYRSLSPRGDDRDFRLACKTRLERVKGHFESSYSTSVISLARDTIETNADRYDRVTLLADLCSRFLHIKAVEQRLKVEISGILESVSVSERVDWQMQDLLTLNRILSKGILPSKLQSQQTSELAKFIKTLQSLDLRPHDILAIIDSNSLKNDRLVKDVEIYLLGVFSNALKADYCVEDGSLSKLFDVLNVWHSLLLKFPVLQEREHSFDLRVAELLDQVSCLDDGEEKTTFYRACSGLEKIKDLLNLRSINID